MAQVKSKPITGLVSTARIVDRIALIVTGFPWSKVESFLRTTGFTQQQLADFLAIPYRTLARRRESGRLTQEESERLDRLSEIYDATFRLLAGNREATRSWLTSPVRGLNNASPMEFARTEVGGREVLNLIGRLEHGVFS